MTLSLPVWTLFACLRVVTYGSMMDGATLRNDTALCELTRATALMKWCPNEREADWMAYCSILNTQGFDVDCMNPNPAEKSGIQNRIAKQRASRQYGCMHAS